MHLKLNLKLHKIKIHKRIFCEDYDRQIETDKYLLTFIDKPSMEALFFILVNSLFIYLAVLTKRIRKNG